MTYSRANLERAERYVEAAESRIARQRRTIDRDQATGRPLTDGLVLLGFFEATRAHQSEVAEQLRQRMGEERVKEP
jgi:hypothetical protein